MEIYAEQGITLRNDNGYAIKPHSSNRSDLGTKDLRWKTMFADYIGNDTKSISIEDIYNAIQYLKNGGFIS